MTARPPKKRILDTVPADDQGSEAFYGFDYQVHVITRLTLEMVAGHEVTETVPEYHEDVVQVRRNKPARFCQIKKRESADSWSISHVESALGKLLAKVKYQDVGELILYGSGRPSTDGTLPLAGLISLIDRPVNERDAEWNTQIEAYVSDFARRFGSSLDEATIRRGIGLLQIRLTMPNPEAIEAVNMMRVAEVIKEVWDVEVTVAVAQRVYSALQDRIQHACTKPKQPRSVKCITVGEARTIIREVLREERYVSGNSGVLVTSQHKLERCGLAEFLPYVLQMRLDARQTKFELELSSSDWQSDRDAIGTRWEEFTNSHPGLTGKRLWEDVRQLLQSISQSWITSKGPANAGPDYAEGVFFDMLSICEVDLTC
jgi:hypothetical protein